MFGPLLKIDLMLAMLGQDWCWWSQLRSGVNIDNKEGKKKLSDTVAR